MDRLTAIAVFTRVVDSGSFSAAADHFNLSKSTASKLVIALEQRLGTRLLQRTTRRLSVTEAGAAYYESCVRLLHDADEAERAITQLAAVPQWTLRLNVPMSFGQLHVVPALGEFLRRYPQIRVDMVLDDRLVDLLAGGFDVGIRIARMTDSSVVSRRLAVNRVVVCASPAYLAANGIPRAPRELVGHACLNYSYLSSHTTWRFVGPRGRESVTVRGPFQANNGDALKAAALAGLGLVQLPTFIAGPELAAGTLQSVLEEYEDRSLGVWALYPSSRRPEPKVRVLVDFLAERFGPQPYWDRTSPRRQRRSRGRRTSP
jgi:DNA-binding transcriptional LysR family regulator